MKKDFQNPLKEKLIDFRTGNISLHEVLDFLYSLDPRIEKKLLKLQKKNLEDLYESIAKSESKKMRRRVLGRL